MYCLCVNFCPYVRRCRTNDALQTGGNQEEQSEEATALKTIEEVDPEAPPAITEDQISNSLSSIISGTQQIKNSE